MALRFNPAPGWPAPPEGFDPAPDWRPDPSWPTAPEGWQFWIDDLSPAIPAPETETDLATATATATEQPGTPTSPQSEPPRTSSSQNNADRSSLHTSSSVASDQAGSHRTDQSPASGETEQTPPEPGRVPSEPGTSDLSTSNLGTSNLGTSNPGTSGAVSGPTRSSADEPLRPEPGDATPTDEAEPATTSSTTHPVRQEEPAPVIHWSNPEPPTTWAPQRPDNLSAPSAPGWAQPGGTRTPPAGTDGPGQYGPEPNGPGQWGRPGPFGQVSGTGSPAGGHWPSGPARPATHEPAGATWQPVPGNTGRPGQSGQTGQPTGQSGPFAVGPFSTFRRVHWVTLVATLAVMLGSVIPFAGYDTPTLFGVSVEWRVTPAALAMSFVYGMVLTGLVLASRLPRFLTAVSLSLLTLGLLGFSGYTIFAVVGLTSGYTPEGSFATQPVHWSPGPGLVLCIVGTAVASFQSLILLRDSDDDAPQ
ncbi:hypothetical protein [Kineosporia sp. NBRC 101731]|uniref:hypothetical protein n=1 Tax=Kineosporia sp. NBRC 101731 TaxID=3032199 RepID=UPI0024A1C8BD|nr:hypothetical protein [Kineosporia sp. NBRC 101731]GLY28048.1 hypothetical protein Kisp02_14130 [Kineosporia sp. NBRC 101731]